MTIEQLMTGAPRTIGADVSIAAARSMMEGYSVHHLPVRDDGRLVGVVAERDLDARASFDLVRDVMKPDPLIVDPDDRADEVAEAMATRHVDAAIVVRGERVVGIFTATDAERALAAALHTLDERR